MLRIGTQKIENWLVMAPMAGITNLPFRLMVRGLGAGLVTTEMVSAMGLKMRQKKTLSSPAPRYTLPGKARMRRI